MKENERRVREGKREIGRDGRKGRGVEGELYCFLDYDKGLIFYLISIIVYICENFFR